MDPVNPPWYDANGIKLVEVQEAFAPNNPYRWPAFKYLARAGKKPGQDEVQDLRKAIWWIEREIAQIEAAQKTHYGPEWAQAMFKDCESVPGVDCQNEWRRGGIRLSGRTGDDI